MYSYTVKNNPQLFCFHVTQNKNEVVYAGFDVVTSVPLAGKQADYQHHLYTYYEMKIFTAGRYCSHVETASSGAVAEDCDRNLQDYLDTLTVNCEGEESEAAILTWTPDENTPDVVYYQVRSKRIKCILS